MFPTNITVWIVIYVQSAKSNSTHISKFSLNVWIVKKYHDFV